MVKPHPALFESPNFRGFEQVIIKSPRVPHLAQDVDGHAFCYANEDLRSGGEANLARLAFLPHGLTVLAVGIEVDFDMSLLVIASGLYRLLARPLRGYGDAQRG